MNDNIFRPNFTLPERLQVAIDDIERHAWLVENMLIMPKHEAWIRRDIRAERAAGTVRIEGPGMDEEAVKDLMRKPPAGSLSENERAVLNAIRAYELTDFLSDQSDIPVDEGVIRQINREFMYGASDVLTPGVYRKGQNKVGMYVPPDQGDVPALMRAFAQWLRADDKKINPILRAGIAHIHLVAIHPFWDGNGRTARALATLILQRSPVHFKKLLSLDTFMFALRDQYLAAIERTLGTQFILEYDATPWLEFFTLALTTHAKQLTDKLTDWHRAMEDIYEAMEASGFNRRQADGVVFARRAGKIIRSDYIEITGVSPGTASRDLAYLVRKGLLIPTGKTRGRIYLYPQKGPQPSPLERGE